MNSNISVIYECFADEVIVKRITKGKFSIFHARGKGNVGNAIVKSNAKSVAIIDKDPGSSIASPHVFDSFSEILDISFEDIIFKFNGSKYLIIINPFLESWIEKLSSKCNIDITKYLKNWKPGNLHDLTRKRKIPIGFSQLIDELIYLNCKDIKILIEFFDKL